MKKSKRMMRKFLLTLSSALLLVSLTVGATVAYLTDTEKVVNTFTVGNVQITLDEAAVTYDAAANKYIEDATAERIDDTQEYHLLPGTEIDKDPTVHVQANSENCYVRALVTFTYKTAADQVLQENWINWDTELWNVNPTPVTTKDTEKDTITRTYEVRYNSIVNKRNAVQDLEIFNKVSIPETLTNEQIATLQGLNITVVANAIQSNGFATADAAWIAFEGQQNNK